MTTTPERQPLSLSNCDDVIAYIPHALGFHPQKSMVLLLIVGNRLEATLRVDLPSEIHPSDRKQWTAQVLQLLRKLPQVSSAVAVVYAPDNLLLGERIPYQDMMDELESDLEGQHIRLSQAWCLWRQQGWDYEHGDVQQSFSRSIGELADTNLTLVLAGSAPLAQPWDGSGIPTWPNAEQIRALSQDVQSDLLDSLDSWAELLDLDSCEASARLHDDPQFAAQILAGLDIRLVRDVLPYLAGVGPHQTVEIVRHLASGKEGRPVQPLADFLLGRGWQSPDWQRLERLWELCRDLLGVAVQQHRHALICLLAWIEWSRGRGSMAVTLLDQTLKENPDYRLAHLLRELMNRGAMPEWATDQLRAWRAQFG